MRELDDHTTDDLFKAGAERHDFAYNPDAWAKMDRMLEADRKAQRWKQGAFSLLAIALLSLLAYLVWPDSRQATADSDATEFIRKQLTDKETDIDSSPATGQAKVQNDKELVQSVPARKIESEGEPLGTTSPAAGRSTLSDATFGGEPSSIAGGGTFRGTAADPSPTEVDANKIEIGTPINQEITKYDAEKELPIPPTSILSTRERTSGGPVRQLPGNGLVALAWDNATYLCQVSEISRDISLVYNTEDQSATSLSSINKNGFAVNASVGSLFGTIVAADATKLRPRIGLTAEYRLNNGKLAIGAGALFNRVYYQTDGNNYKAKEDFWVDGLKASTVESSCDVLEIPVFATYYLNGAQSSGVFFGGGLTSYLMLKESFQFEYDEMRPGQIMKWQEKGTNNHLFGMGQVNIGYQRAVARRSALQVQGFVQLPLTGIGQGNVNLWTVGASVNYQFSFRR